MLSRFDPPSPTGVDFLLASYNVAILRGLRITSENKQTFEEKKSVRSCQDEF